MNKLLTIILLFPCMGALSQRFQGSVLDHASKLPIAYVNIGIVGKNLGTVSDEQGHFSILIDSLKHADDTLRFSMIGYESRSYQVREFLRQHRTESTIFLREKMMVLKEVVVSNNKNANITLGNIPQSKFTNAGFIYNNLGHEIGTRFTKPTDPILLESVQLNFVKCEYKKIFLRLNIYKISDTEQEENLLQQPIYVSLTRKEALQRPVIDVSKHDIYINSDFIVSVELVKDLGEKGLLFYATVPSKDFPTVIRNSSQSDWNDAMHKSKPVGISIIVKAH